MEYWRSVCRLGQLAVSMLEASCRTDIGRYAAEPNRIHWTQESLTRVPWRPAVSAVGSVRSIRHD